MARVTIRAFAALRELVGPQHETDATDVQQLVSQLVDRLGPELARRLERSKIVVDDHEVPHDDRTPLTDGAVVILLPPFAGG